MCIVLIQILEGMTKVLQQLETNKSKTLEKKKKHIVKEKENKPIHCALHINKDAK